MVRFNYIIVDNPINLLQFTKHEIDGHIVWVNFTPIEKDLYARYCICDIYDSQNFRVAIDIINQQQLGVENIDFNSLWFNVMNNSISEAIEYCSRDVVKLRNDITTYHVILDIPTNDGTIIGNSIRFSLERIKKHVPNIPKASRLYINQLCKRDDLELLITMHNVYEELKSIQNITSKKLVLTRSNDPCKIILEVKINSFCSPGISMIVK